MKTHWRYDWKRCAWVPADNFTRWVMQGAPVVIEINNVATLYRNGNPPVTYRTDASTRSH